jgi:hypothetical protein
VSKKLVYLRPVEELSLDRILKRQLEALDETTSQLLSKSKGLMSKDDIQSLATCIKITLELKAKEAALLADINDEDLAKAVEK